MDLAQSPLLFFIAIGLSCHRIDAGLDCGERCFQFVGNALQQRTPEVLRCFEDLGAFECFNDVVFFQHQTDKYRERFE